MQKDNIDEKELKRIVFTGGHAASVGIALVEKIKELGVTWEIHWIGSAKAMEGKGVATIESKLLPLYGVSFYHLISGRLQRRWTKYTLLSLLKTPIGFFHAMKLLTKIKPGAVFSLGGYSALPVCLVAFFMGIPIVIHEQTTAVGLSNKVVSLLAKKIAISRPESKNYFPGGKTLLTGNPVRKKILEVSAKTQISSTPTIYVTCGSTGSQIINRVVKQILPTLLERYYVIHQTGDLDLEEFEELKKSLPESLSGKYEVHSFIGYPEVKNAFAKADIIVGRSGANTVSDILAAVRPSVLIPIPWTRYDEQTKNAQMAKSAGIARIVKQDDLSPNSLLSEIEYIFENWKDMVESFDASTATLDREAAGKVVDLIKTVVK